MIAAPRLVFPVILASLMLGVATYAVTSQAGDPAPKGAAPQAMPVQVQTLKQQDVALWSEYSGRLAAVDYVQIRPRVSGTPKKQSALNLRKISTGRRKNSPLPSVSWRRFKPMLHHHISRSLKVRGCLCWISLFT